MPLLLFSVGYGFAPKFCMMVYLILMIECTMRYSLMLVFVLMLTACGTAGVTRNPNSTFTVSAQYGSLNGSWDRAQREAMQKAQEHCEQLGLQYNFMNEARSGVVGWSPQVSAITFTCSKKTAELLKVADEECKNDFATTELDPIRNKVELIRKSAESSVPFDIASNDKYPTEQELVAIGKWAKLREVCVERNRQITEVEVVGLTPLQQTYTQQMRGYSDQMQARVGELIVALYQSKLSYSEFALKRYEITRSIVAAQRDYRTATLMADRDSQMKAQQIAEQQMQNNLMLWSTYMQSVNARQPQFHNSDVRLRTNCTSNRIGQVVTTNCN